MNTTPIPPRTILIAAVLVAASLVLPCAHAQPGEQDRKTFEDTKAKVEQGDAPAQPSSDRERVMSPRQSTAAQKRAKESPAEIEVKP